VEIEFQVREAAVAGASALLDLRRVALNEGGLPLLLEPVTGEDATDGRVRINTAPLSADDEYASGYGETLVIAPEHGILRNDMDPDADVLVAVLDQAPAFGTLVLNADGSFTYAPQDGFSGTDFFRYRADDGIARSSAATVHIRVDAPPNRDPVFVSTPPDTFHIVPATEAVGDSVMHLPASGSFEFRLQELRGNSRAEVGIYKVEDAAGRVNGLLPGTPGYEQAALSPSNRQILFERSDRKGDVASVTLGAGYYAFYVAGSKGTATWFSLQEANGDRIDRLRASIAHGRLTLGWELQGNDARPDFDEIVLTARLPAGIEPTFVQPRHEAIPLTAFSQSVPGDRVLQVPAGDASISAVFTRQPHSAGYESEFGIYRVDDPSGRIGALAPGDAGYAQAAIARAQTVFAPGVPEGGIARVALEPGAFYGFYLIADGSRERFLARNPSDSLLRRPLAYFSFDAANPDRFDHLRGSVSQGMLALRWEDQVFGGDRDFDDGRVQVRLEREVPGGVFEYRAQAQDADGDVLAYSLLSGPQGASIDPQSGLLRWQAQAGQHEFVIRVEDGRGGSAEQRFLLDVRLASASSPPRIEWNRFAAAPGQHDVGRWLADFLFSSACNEGERDVNRSLRVTVPLAPDIKKAERFRF
jgi:VCBS repeat-containing protein